MTGAKHWAFTIQNPPESHSEVVERWTGEEKINYLIFGKEIAPTTGTPHWQGFVSLSTPHTLRRVRSILNGGFNENMNPHLEVARGTILQNIEYCKKDGQWFELGTQPAEQTHNATKARKLNYQQAVDLAIKGEFDAIDPGIKVRHMGNLMLIAKNAMPKMDVQNQAKLGIWLKGKSRIGKTWLTFKLWPDHYQKPDNKWWDGYRNEPVICYQDMGPKQALWADEKLKIWADRYPFIAEVKGGGARIRPKLFVITSQYLITELWTDPRAIEAIENRFQVIDMDKHKDYGINTEMVLRNHLDSMGLLDLCSPPSALNLDSDTETQDTAPVREDRDGISRILLDLTDESTDEE